MTIFEILNEIQDVRHGGELCDFNGYLEDYLGQLDRDAKEYELLNALLEMDADIKVIHNLKVSLSKTSISNQIIRYKDINKLGDYPLNVEYILSIKQQDQARAILLDEEFILAKGLYYALSEEPSQFNSLRNDIIVLPLNEDLDTVRQVYNSLFTVRTGAIQRRIDQKHLSAYDEVLEKAIEMANNTETITKEKILEDRKNRNIVINKAIATWYLLKKFIYVQYMVNKDILRERHDGDIKAQRNQAKINADKIRFAPLSSLWRIDNEEEMPENN